MQGWLSDLAGRTKALVEEVASADLVVMVSSAGTCAQAAAVIGEACAVRKVMTMALIIGSEQRSDEELSKTLATLRPHASMLVIATARNTSRRCWRRCGRKDVGGPTLLSAKSQPRRHLIAVAITCGMKAAIDFFVSRVTGPAIPTAATTSPLSSRIGAAIETMPSSLSSSSIAQPRWRVKASSRPTSPGW